MADIVKHAATQLFDGLGAGLQPKIDGFVNSVIDGQDVILDDVRPLSRWEQQLVRISHSDLPQEVTLLQDGEGKQRLSPSLCAFACVR